MNERVAEWFATTNNPLAREIRAVRDIIVEHDDITETVKYRAPAFEVDGLLCYFHWSAKERVSLIFPKGSEVPSDHAIVERGSNQQCLVHFSDQADIAAKADDLRHLIDACIAHRELS